MNLFSNEIVLYKRQSQYNDITVTQRGDLVTLWSPETIKQSEISLTQPLQPRLEYNNSMLMTLAFCPDPRFILGLGLGGGVIPTIFNAVCPQAVVEVVEIDREMIPVAENFFHFQVSDKLRIIVQDAYDYITVFNSGPTMQTEKKYDVIFMDTYLGNTLPSNLKSMTFLEACGSLLSENGVFAANLMSGDTNQLKKMLRKLNQVFDTLWLLPGIFTGNVIVFGRKKEITEKAILENALALPKRLPFPFNALQLVVRIKKRPQPPL